VVSKSSDGAKVIFCYNKVNMYYKRFQFFFFLAALALSLVLTLLVFRPYLTLLAFGGVLAIVSRPLYRYIKKFLKSSVAASFLSVLFIAVVILLPVTFFLAALASEAFEIYSDVKGRLHSLDIVQYLSGILPQSLHEQIPQLLEQSFSLATNVAQFISSNIFGLFSNAFAIIFGFLVMLISVYYLLKDGEKIKNKLLALSPLSDEYDEIVFNKIAIAVRAVMGGILILGLIKGILAGFFFWLFGLPAPLFWGAMTGVASFVPIFGISLTTVPAAIYLFITGNLAGGIALLSVSLLIIGTVDNFLQPKLVESKTKIHPLLILLAILGGLQFYGFSGFIIGPLTLAITMALFDIYEKEFRHCLEKESNNKNFEEEIS
jgi:predicted PurR-regulated permease PerM